MLISEIHKVFSRASVYKKISLITEGGNVVEGISHINQENTKPMMSKIYKKIFPLLGITKTNTVLLG